MALNTAESKEILLNQCYAHPGVLNVILLLLILINQNDLDVGRYTFYRKCLGKTGAFSGLVLTKY